MFKRRWFYWLSLVALCLLLGLIDAFRSYSGAYHNGVYRLEWGIALRWDLSGWIVWVPLIPLIMRLCDRMPIGRENWPSRMLIFGPLGLLASAIRTLFPILVHLIIEPNFSEMIHWLSLKPYFLLTDFLFGLAFYGFILAFGQARNYYRRYREEELRRSHLEAQLARAELRALKMQLHPHFLFNTLHSISALQLEDVAAAQKMMARLGDFLRLTLTTPTDGASLAPRLGLAYTPDKKQNWVLRARAGIFYDRISEALTLESLRLDGLRQEQIIVDAPSFPDPFAGGNAVNAVPTTRLLEPSLRPPLSLQARVELERQLPRGWRISLSHNWTRGWGELRSRNINAPLVDAAHPDPFIAPRPFGVARNVLQFESSGSVKGRVLFVGVNQAANKRFNIFGGYLYFDFLTDADNAFLSPQSSYDLRGEWAPPVWQTRHRMFLTATINLPWQSRAAFSLNAASGAAYNITTGRDNNGDGAFNDRPGVVAATQPQAVLTPFGALDPGASNGNLRRNAGTNPANATLDLNLSRMFAFGRPGAAGERPFKLAANVRAGNLLNRANLLGAGGVLASPFFGRANVAGPARRIEIGLRFSF